MYAHLMRRILTGALPFIVLLTACSSDGSSDAAGTTTSAAPTTLPATTVAPTTTLPPTTLPPTTLPPTGTVQECPEFRTLDDQDGDGWGECIVTMEDAQGQYYVISGQINGTIVSFGDQISNSECLVYLDAAQKFIDDLKGTEWPADVQPQLDELIAAHEYELYLRDDDCYFSSNASMDEATARTAKAIFEWRTAIGSPTDI